MKKYLLSCLLIPSLLLSFPCFALDDGQLTVGDTLTRYYTDLFPTPRAEASAIILKMRGVEVGTQLYFSLQRAVYFGIEKNTTRTIRPAKVMTDRSFAQLLAKHFSVTLEADTSPLTSDDYVTMMSQIRGTVTYTLIQKINSNSLSPASPETSSKTGSPLTHAKNYYIFESVYTLLNNNALKPDSVTQTDLVYGATEGLVEAYGDEYTRFFRPAESTAFQESLGGTIVGIGVVIDTDITNAMVVRDVILGSPAEKAGILPRDTITKIDAMMVDPADGFEDEIRAIRGQKGTEVKVTVQSEKVTRTYTIVRDVIQVKIVDIQSRDDAMIIRYAEVAFGSDAIVQKTLEEFLKSGKKRLILDLRNNPGGSMYETRNILNYFIPKKEPLYIFENPQSKTTIYASNNALTDWSAYEIVFLVNGGTASAAEVLALVLHEYFPTNSIIIGEKTYGKGSVQELVPFDDNSLLKYTIAKWYSPKHVSVDKTGITPDVIAPLDLKLWKKEKKDTQLESAVEYSFGG